MSNDGSIKLDKDAEAVFRQHLVQILPSLRAFARGLCGDRDLADDLVQDAMVRSWAARSSFTPGTNFRAWIFMILRNQFYTVLRKNSRISAWDPELAERLLVVDAAQQERLHLQDVARALQKLSPEQREVILLVGASGMSYEEAAETMGCAVGTVKSRLARGRAALSDLVDGVKSTKAEPKPPAKNPKGNTIAGRTQKGSESQRHAA